VPADKSDSEHMASDPVSPAPTPTDWRTWLQAVRAFSFPASIVPGLVGAAMAAHWPGPVAWWLLPPVLIASVLIHAATNLVSDYFDFVKGLDRDYTYGSSGVLVAGRLTPRQVLLGSILLFALVAAIGLGFVWLRGWPILVLGLVGILGGWFYTADPLGYKYIALGDPLVFLLMGPLMVIGAFYMLTGSYTHAVLVASLPIGCLVAAILDANNIRDVEHDRHAHIRTIASLLGPRRSRLEYYALLAAAYVVVGAVVVTARHSAWTLIVLASAPLAWRAARILHRSRPGDATAIATLDVQTARLHLAFGLLWAGGLWLDAVLT